MKKFLVYPVRVIPEEYFDDVREITDTIRKDIGVYIAMDTAYVLWASLSKDCLVDWLPLDDLPCDMTLVQFLILKMKKKGFFQEI